MRLLERKWLEKRMDIAMWLCHRVTKDTEDTEKSRRKHMSNLASVSAPFSVSSVTAWLTFLQDSQRRFIP